MKINSKKDISFILACYNVEKYVERAVESIFKGGFLKPENVQIIAINDGSTDKTLDKLYQIANKYPLTIFDQANSGVGVTKNRGLESANGEYVMILDADDWIDAEVIAKQLQFAQKHNIDLIAFGMQYVNEKMKYMHLKDIFPGPFNEILSGRRVLLNGYQPSSVCLFLMHKKFFKDDHMRFYNGTQLDVEISTRLMLKAKRVYFSKEIGYYYFRNEGSVTKATNINKLKSYLSDSVRVASLGTNNISKTDDKALKKVLIQNNNSIVWNLIWRFVRHPKEVDNSFKLKCLKLLKQNQLYPICGPLKTKFQRLSTLFFNQEWLLKLYFKNN